MIGLLLPTTAREGGTRSHLTTTEDVAVNTVAIDVSRSSLVLPEDAGRTGSSLLPDELPSSALDLLLSPYTDCILITANNVYRNETKVMYVLEKIMFLR